MTVDLTRLSAIIVAKGAELIGFLDTRDGQVVVLVHLPNERIQPFVTWRARHDMTSGLYLGHYHNSEQLAREDFFERASR